LARHVVKCRLCAVLSPYEVVGVVILAHHTLRVVALVNVPRLHCPLTLALTADVPIRAAGGLVVVVVAAAVALSGHGSVASVSVTCSAMSPSNAASQASRIAFESS